MKFWAWCLLIVVAAVAVASDSDLRSHPRGCPDNTRQMNLPHVAASRLPLLVRHAIALLPFIQDRQVVILAHARDVSVFLVDWAYSRETASDTVGELEMLTEFTIDHHFPIFINAESPHYRRLSASWDRGKSPNEAARVLASDIYHEYRHAACGEEELDALAAQISLLKRWRSENLLRIADPYIAAKELRRRNLQAKTQSASH